MNVVLPVNGSAYNSLIPETKRVSADDLCHHSVAQILELVRLQDSPGISVYYGVTVLVINKS